MNEETLNNLCREVSYMSSDSKKWLRELWRNRYGYVDAEASVKEMAIELARDRGWIK